MKTLSENKSSYLILAFFMLLSHVFVYQASANLRLHLEGLINPIFGRGWLDVAAYQGVTNKLETYFGDPIGFKLMLENDSDAETPAMYVQLSAGGVRGYAILVH